MSETTNIKTLKNGETVELIRVCPLDTQPDVCAYLKQTVTDTIKLGFCSPDTAWDNSKVGAVVMKKDAQIIGIVAYHNKIIYGDNKNKKLLPILIGGVNKEYRSIGAYSILHKELEELAREQGYGAILSYVRFRNQNMMSALKALGKNITTVTCHKDL